jgi:hypothetical protein
MWTFRRRETLLPWTLFGTQGPDLVSCSQLPLFLQIFFRRFLIHFDFAKEIHFCEVGTDSSSLVECRDLDPKHKPFLQAVCVPI